MAVQVWRAVGALVVRLGEPRVRVDCSAGLAVLVWPESGGWIEVGADEVRWFLVDPGAVLLPEEGHASRGEAAAALVALVKRWSLAAPGPPAPIGWETFLDVATRSLHRLEYVGGHVYAMAGGTPEHSYVGGNVYALCKAGLGRGACKVFNPDLYILSVNSTDPGERRVRLPDATIVCGPIARDEVDPRIVTNPVVLFEVLSPSNRAKDAETNVQEYRQIATLRHFVVVDITRRSVHVHSRTDAGWTRVDVSHGAVDLPAVALSLPLAGIFEGVDEL